MLGDDLGVGGTGQVERERAPRGRGICAHRAELLCCTTETNTAL